LATLLMMLTPLQLP